MWNKLDNIPDVANEKVEKSEEYKAWSQRILAIQ
jgi:hypothetical protein